MESTQAPFLTLKKALNHRCTRTDQSNSELLSKKEITLLHQKERQLFKILNKCDNSFESFLQKDILQISNCVSIVLSIVGNHCEWQKDAHVVLMINLIDSLSSLFATGTRCALRV